MLQKFCAETVVLPCQVFTAGSDTVVIVEVLVVWGELCCVKRICLDQCFGMWRCMSAAAVTAVFELLLNGCRCSYCAI